LSAAKTRLARGGAGTVAVLAFAAALGAATPLPRAPVRWVSDEAGVLSWSAAKEIDRKLEAFEHEQGSQILVAIFRRLPPDEALEDWTQRVAESWRVGRAKQDDGAVLFIFVDDRQLRLEVGYGLEGALTDLESKAILDDVLIPRLRSGDWDGGVTAAADAILAAVRGEYKPQPFAGRGRGPAKEMGPFGIFFVIAVMVMIVMIGRLARRSGWRGGGWGGGGFGGFSGGGFSGGGFSGGGGSFGGGGASGRW
jgi:uncharacterized protein